MFLLFLGFGAGQWSFALKILLLITCSGYFYSFKNCFNSSKLIITFSGLDTKTIILLARLYGMLFFVWSGFALLYGK